MRLYDYPAPSPRRLRIFLAEKGLDIPRVAVDLAKGEQLGPEFRARNPRCTVPMLELDDGTCLSDCLAICEYLEALHPEPPLLGATPLERAQIVMWYQRIDADGFNAVAEVMRNASPAFKDRALPGPEPTPQIPALVERGRQRAQVFYRDMNARLMESEYVAGPTYTLADIHLLSVVDFGAGWGRMPVPAELTALLAWHQRVSARPSAKA
ncbi:MAG: glutathione S-transferase [Rhodocyclaceae bacterium]|nr:MAG: glutathione S-transferase [Rhodocyclaceae bacterium]